MAKYNDKVILSIAMNLKAPVATFDKKLLSQANNFKVGILE